MKTKILISIISIVSAIIIVWLLFFNSEESNNIIIKPSYGKFIVNVTITGELKAKNSIEIKGPSQASSVGIRNMTISKLIPEGTVVDSGDFVGELDKSDIFLKA